MYNYHMHTTFCDGKNTAEEMVLSAIEKEMVSIGFSGHGYTEFDQTYCMKDMIGYMEEVWRLQKKYKNQIQIYLGVEEDAFAPVNRKGFDYVIGSSHYFDKEGRYLPIDLSNECFKECFAQFQYDVVSLAENYYTSFCKYIANYKPHIIGHFDLITKFDEVGTSLFLQNPKYNEVAEKYVNIATESNCIFEVNTGAMARGLRTTPYPSENLLHILKKNGAKITISSDSHSQETLNFGFEDMRQYLYDIGFRHTYIINQGKFEKISL